MSSDDACDCVVIGAGLSGLVAARDLRRAGLRVLVLEAAPRIGGRMQRTRLQCDAWIDLGGQWVGATQDHIQALLDACAITRFASPHVGRTVLHFDAQRYEFSGFFQGFPEGEAPAIDAAHWQDAMNAWQRFDALAQSLHGEYPQQNAHAHELDSCSLAQWIDANTSTPFARWYFEYMSRAVGFLGPAEPHEVSLLHALWGQKSAPQSEHPEAQLMHGGAGQVPALIAAELDDVIRVDEPVVSIRERGDALQITSTRATYRSAHAIIAMPPCNAARIVFDPPLSSARQLLGAQMRMGRCAKVLLSYSTPWWREHGLSGLAMGNRPCIELVADSSDPSMSTGVLAAFVVGDRYTRWIALAAHARRDAVLEDLAQYFGASARNPTSYHEVDWPQEPWIGGAFAGFMPPRAWTECGDALRVPHGRVHWAGTEIAPRWAGFFDGAVRTGEDAGRAVVDLHRASSNAKGKLF